MPCSKCASTHQQEFQGELTVAFPGKERLNLPPIYICQKTVVCLGCGYTELVVPTTELETLRKGIGSVLIVRKPADYPPPNSFLDRSHALWGVLSLLTITSLARP